MKIAISGKMCSGKSSFAKLIKEKDNRYEIYSFATKVKLLANELFGMDLENRIKELYKNNYLVHLKNRKDISELNNFVYKTKPLILDSSNTLEENYNKLFTNIHHGNYQ